VAPPFFLTFGLDTQRTVWTAEDGAQWRVWEFQPADPTGKTVVAFHGGGWIYQPSVLNWLDYTNMARDTGATVVVPLYPLATTEAGRATVVIPEAADFISHQIELHGAENVSLYADSAGFTIAISAVRQLLLAGKSVPSSMVLISGSIDSTLSNPDIRNVGDPIFDVDNAKDVWQSHWYDGITDLRDPLVSPLFFEPEILKALPPTTIYVGSGRSCIPTPCSCISGQLR
jgi:acetyl esterase/lipase